MSRPASASRPATILAAVLAVILAGLGILLLADREGLRAEYFALGAPWTGRPATQAISEPRLAGTADIHEFLATEVVFSVRWSGWWEARESGARSFAVVADDGGYLRIDGKLRVDTRGVLDEPVSADGEALESGLHRIEVGLFQTVGEAQLAVAVTGLDGTPRPFALSDLYAGRPVLLRRALRRALAGWPFVLRRLLGAALVLSAGLFVGRILLTTGTAARWARGLRGATKRPGARPALLLALFLAVFFLVLPHTGTVRGGDDVAYLAVAQRGEQSWFFNRYAHVYLLRLFIALCGGDPLLATRVWWSFAFSATVSALAVAVRAVGPGLQLRTLAVTLFVLLSQTTLMGSIGAAFADYSSMMFVTAAVAVYLHGFAGERDRPPPAGVWHALAIGALTVAAMRSKEVGAILLLLPPLLVLHQGRLDLRRFARLMAYWTAGAVATLSILVVLDGWLLGDFLFTFDSARYAQSQKMNFPAVPAPRGEHESWLDVVWRPGLDGTAFSMRSLWLGVVAAALAAGLRRRPLELRLLHFLPVAYLLALIVLYIRLPHPFSGRMLITILPAACLMMGFLLRDAGLEELSWQELLRPAVSLPVAIAAGFVFLLVAPYGIGHLEAADFLPVAALDRYGWRPDDFATGVLLPILVLTALSGLALVVTHRQARVAALLVACLASFGLGCESNRASLARGWAQQKGELLLYPWRVFHDELEAGRPSTIAFSRDLAGRYGMAAGGRSSLASLMLRRPVRILLERDLPRNVDVAIASRPTYRAWLREAPELAASARPGPAGAIVLVYPRQALGATRGEG